MNLNINDPNFDKGKLDAYNKQDYQNIEDNIKNDNYNIILVDTKNTFSVINRKYIPKASMEVLSKNIKPIHFLAIPVLRQFKLHMRRKKICLPLFAKY